MRVWIDLSNSPHPPLFEPVVADLEGDGHEVFLTARDHAQTAQLARLRWPDVTVVGEESPGPRIEKIRVLVGRAIELRRFARRRLPDVALSHGSYAHVVAARSVGIPALTMMDYEFQPANHLSFRLSGRVIVPRLFPGEALRRAGAREHKVRRYDGFKEELYLAGFRPDGSVLSELGLDSERVIAVFRSPAEGAMYHPGVNERFERLVADAASRDDVQAVLLPRIREQVRRAAGMRGLIVPARPVDGRSLLALADLMVGGGGTMTRESALLGTPTYTSFDGRLAAVDAELMRIGRLHDLRDPGTRPLFVKKHGPPNAVPTERAAAILAVIRKALGELAGSS